MKAEIQIVKNCEYLITETRLKADISADAIISVIRAHRATGSLTFQFHEGGIRDVLLTEKTKPSQPQRDEIRKILNKI